MVSLSIGSALPLNDFDMNDLEPFNYPERTISKKDIFTSRGWGAAGMPYSLYYVGKPPNGRSSGGNEQLVDSNDTNEQSNGSYEALRSDEPPNQKGKNGKDSKYVIPQLFVSYGWGPMG